MLASELDAPNQPAGEAAVRPLTVGAPPRKLIRKRPTAGTEGGAVPGVWGRGRSAVKGRAGPFRQRPPAGCRAQTSLSRAQKCSLRRFRRIAGHEIVRLQY